MAKRFRQFKSSTTFAPVAALLLGGAFIGWLLGTGISGLFGVGIALYLLLGYFNNLERRGPR